MKVLLIDDEQDARLLLRQYLADFPQLSVVGEAGNGLEAILMIDEKEPDLIFLDIQMPGASGFQVLQQIIHVPQIIFSTAFDRYALKAFEENAVDYLLKPYTRERFGRSINKVLLSQPSRNLHSVRQLSENMPDNAQTSMPSRILVEQGNKMVAIPLHSIVYIEADGDYTRLHTPERFFLSSLNMFELEQRLTADIFQRVHRSAIVNMRCVVEVIKEPNGPVIILPKGIRQKVSRSYLEDIRKWMV